MVNTEIRLIIFAAKDGEVLYSQQKQDWKLTVAQIVNSLLPNSDLNCRKREPLDHWVQFCSVQWLSHVWLFVTPWTPACQASLSITNSQILPKLMSIELVMPSNHLILCHPLSPPAINLSQHQGLFKWVSFSHQVAKVLEFQLQHQSVQWTPRTELL